MKTNEFIKEVEAIGFNVSEGEGIIYVRNGEIGKYLADVSTNCLYMLDTDYDGALELSEDKRHKLFKLLTEYASTPIEERKEEKKYRYYLKDTTGLKLNHGNLLYKQKGFNNFMFDIDNFNRDEIECEFTHRELRACGINLTLLQENYEEDEVK